MLPKFLQSAVMAVVLTLPVVSVITQDVVAQSKLTTSALLALPKVLTLAQNVTTQNKFTVNNDSNIDIRYLYISDYRQKDWGPNLLGQRTLGDGDQMTLYFQPNTRSCNYDIRAVFENSRSVVKRNVNLCQTSILRITSSGITP